MQCTAVAKHNEIHKNFILDQDNFIRWKIQVQLFIGFKNITPFCFEQTNRVLILLRNACPCVFSLQPYNHILLIGNVASSLDLKIVYTNFTDLFSLFLLVVLVG